MGRLSLAISTLDSRSRKEIKPKLTGYFMEFSSRVQNLSIKQKRLLWSKITDEMDSQAIPEGDPNSVKNASLAKEVSRKINPDLVEDCPEKTLSNPSTYGGIKNLVAYVVLSDETQFIDNSHFSIESSNIDVKIAQPKTGSNSPIARSDLRNFLSEKLPDYMIPTLFIAMKELPRNRNGKIDYHALPQPVLAENCEITPSEDPLTSTQLKIKKSGLKS